MLLRCKVCRGYCVYRCTLFSHIYCITPPSSLNAPNAPQDKKDAPTGLMHAARGGRATFKWALSKLSTETRSVRLNDVLPTSGSYDKSMGMLLAEAASGGDIEVLHNVVWAIEVMVNGAHGKCH